MTRFGDAMTNLYLYLSTLFLSLGGGTVTGPTAFQQGLTANGNVVIQNANVTGNFQAQNANVLGTLTAQNANVAGSLNANGNTTLQNANVTGVFRGLSGDLQLGIPGVNQGKLILSYGAVVGQGVMIYGTGNTIYMMQWPSASYANVVMNRVQDYQGNGLDMSNVNTSTILRANGGAVAATFTPTGVDFPLLVRINGGGGLRSGSQATPNGNVTGSPGDVYLSTAGGAGATFWVKETGVATNTGWVAK